jgi:hypothetical protein
MNFINKYTVFAILITINTLFSTNQSGSVNTNLSLVPQMTKSRALKLAQHSLRFLNENKSKIVAQKNESGFIRVTISTTEFKKWGIDKIRLNFWCPENGIDIQSESLHNHPRYFESFLVHGGYTHAIYKVSQVEQNLTDEYEQYRLYKEKQNKFFKHKGIIRLQHVKNESIENGITTVFPTSLIHQILTTKGETLSLNVLYSFDKNENANDFYDVFVSPGIESSKYIKTKRVFLTQKEASKAINKIIQLLEHFISQK